MIERVEVEHLVVGAGVVGLAIAAALARSGRSVFVLEAGSHVGCGISSRNSEVIHSGIYYPTNSLKHLLCVEGRRLLYAYCDSHGIAYRKCGKIVVAVDDVEAKEIAAIAQQAAQNNVENVETMDATTVKRMEPAVRAVSALHVKETGIIDSHGFMLSLVGEIEDSGGAVMLNHRVLSGRPSRAHRYELDVASPSGRLTITTRTLVLAAGPWTNALTAAIEGMGAIDAPRLFLAKGSYFAFSGRPTFTRLVYPVPVQGGLGIHLTLALDGRIRLGPDVEWLETRDPDQVDFGVEPSSSGKILCLCATLLAGPSGWILDPRLCRRTAETFRSGRPAADFLLQGPQQHGLPGVVALYGIESPGLTSSLAIGARVVSMLAV